MINKNEKQYLISEKELKDTIALLEFAQYYDGVVEVLKNKKPVQKLDRKKVEKKVNYWMAHYSPDVDWLIESIMSLILEQPDINRVENDIYEGIKKEKLQYVKTDRDKYYMAKRLAGAICKTGGEDDN